MRSNKHFVIPFVILCVIIAALISCSDWFPQTPVSFPHGSPKRQSPDTGWTGGGNTAVPRQTGSEGTWYQIFTISFYDSDGDGKGDIPGITSQLDYLNDTNTDPHNENIDAMGECNDSLHLKGIWLTPIMKAVSYHKYDTIDYMMVDPDFGTIEDFTELLEESHKRGLKIILDLAVNHTSPAHPWFQLCLDEWRSGKMDKYSTFYNIRAFSSDYIKPTEISGHWYDFWSPGTWAGTTPDGKRIWFYGAFNEMMPDLNWDSTALKQEFESVLKYWLVDVGIDGFRLDATKHIYETGEWTGDTGRNIAYWTWFAETVRKYKGDAFMVGENLSGPDEILEYHRPGMSSFFTGAHDRVSQAVNDGRGTYFTDGVLWWTREVKKRHPLATGSPFLSNHDEDRSDKWLPWDDQKKMAASLLLLFPGTPFMYYGEEIGLKGWKEGIPSDDKWVRGPMIFNWGVDTETDLKGRPVPMIYMAPNGWDLGNPSGHGRPAWEERGGVCQQLEIEDSLLRHYIKINNWKNNKYPWIAWGVTDDRGIEIDGDGRVGAYRVTDNNSQNATFGKTVIIAHNTARDPRTGDSPDGYIKIPGAVVLEAVSAQGDPDPVHFDSNLGAYWIKPYSTVIFGE